jgi:hypothetical protein
MIENSEKSPKNESDPGGPVALDHRSFTIALRQPSSKVAQEVLLVPGFDPQDPRLNAADTRVSVLYPVDCESFKLPIGDRYSIAFLAAKRPLELLARLGEPWKQNLLFGCGICSVVLVSTDSAKIDSVIKNHEESVYAWERWNVANGAVATFEDGPNSFESASPKHIYLRLDYNLSDSTVWLVHELMLNLNRFYQDAQRYAPFVTEELEALAADVNELIVEIRADEDVQRQAHAATPDPSQPFPAESHLELLGAKKRLNANLDLLVQLNSALVYAVSQAFAGAIPINQRFPHISQHSLLGTGTAWRAIQRTCSSVFGTFRDAQFPEKLRERLESNPANVEPTDNQSQHAAEVRLNTRVVHFSARSGFGESDAAITCPAQSIQVCDQPEWSLCTATHEILHAHVRELIAAVFCEAENEETPLPFDKSLGIAAKHYAEYVDALSRGEMPKVQPLHEVRHGFLEFALEYRANIIKAKEKFAVETGEFDADNIEVAVTLPKNVEAIFRAFKKSFRLLEETIVHILDLHYFFGGDVELFSDSLWYSWSIVPSVIEKLDWYILRTLLALASTSTGKPYPRLNEAARVLSDSLYKILGRKKGAVIATEVLRRLNTIPASDAADRENSQFLLWLDLLFPACLPLVDLTTKYFVNNRLKAEFANPRGDQVDGEGHYPIDLPNFAVRGIANPIALIHDRLRAGLDQEGMRAASHEETARSSAWLLLALSSALK